MKNDCVHFKKEHLLTSSSDASSDDDDELQQADYEKSASTELSSSSAKSSLAVSVVDSTNYSKSKMILRDHSYRMDRDLNPQQQQQQQQLQQQQQQQHRHYNFAANFDQDGINFSSQEPQEEISMQECFGDSITDYCMVVTTTKHL